MTATATTLTFQQMLSRGVADQLPSMILVNAGEAATDPIDDVISQLAKAWDSKQPVRNGMEARNYVGSREDAPRHMRMTVLEQKKLDEMIRKSRYGGDDVKGWDR